MYCFTFKLYQKKQHHTGRVRHVQINVALLVKVPVSEPVYHVLVSDNRFSFQYKISGADGRQDVTLNGVLCTCAGKLSFQITNKQSLNMVSMFLEGMSLPVSQHVCT